jgi:hypothetical protein
LTDESTPSSIRTVILIPAGTVKGAALPAAAATTHTKMIAPVILSWFMRTSWIAVNAQYSKHPEASGPREAFSQV